MIMDILRIALTALLSCAALFVITKAVGHKQISELDFFDYLSGITVGSVAAELATELEEPLRPLTALAVYGAVSVFLSFLTHKLPKTRKFINGAPSILMDGGKLFRKNMKKANIDLSEFMVMCREAGYFNLGDIETAVFEQNGRLSILPKSEKQPLSPSLVGITPRKSEIFTEVIMDGRILGENLSRAGLTPEWLENKLKAFGYGSAKEVFLALLDKEGEITVYGVGD